MTETSIPTTTLYLVRHGETEWNRTGRYQGSSDVPLNATGERQAERLAEWLRTDPDAPTGDAIVASPLSRAFETARAVGRAIGVDEILTDGDLQERGYGVAEGLTREEREERYPDANWDGLETWEHASERAMRGITEVTQRYPGQRVFVVCHGGIINAILATLSGGEIGTGKTVILNTSITTLTHDASGWTIVAHNETPHLDPEPAVAE